MISRPLKGVVVSAGNIIAVQYYSDSADRPWCAIRSARNDLIFELMLSRGAKKRVATLAVNANSLT